MFGGQLKNNLQFLYEGHIMSFDGDFQPNNPEFAVEMYYNHEGMVRAWKLYNTCSTDMSDFMPQPGPKVNLDGDRLPEWLMGWRTGNPHDVKVTDAGYGAQKADGAVKGIICCTCFANTWLTEIASFETHVDDPGCAAIILGGICHDKGYIMMLKRYLEKEPDGGKSLAPHHILHTC